MFGNQSLLNGVRIGLQWVKKKLTREGYWQPKKDKKSMFIEWSKERIELNMESIELRKGNWQSQEGKWWEGEMRI